MLPHPLTNFEIQKYYQNYTKFNRFYSRDNLSKIKHGAYVMNLDEYKSIGTHWIALYVGYFDSFTVAYISQEIKKFIGNKNISTTIYRTQPNDSIICWYFYSEFIDFVLKDKNLLDFTYLFSPNKYEKNDKYY